MYEFVSKTDTINFRILRAIATGAESIVFYKSIPISFRIYFRCVFCEVLSVHREWS